MFVLSKIKDNKENVLVESKDYMKIVEYIIGNVVEHFMTEKEARRMFYDLNTKGVYTMKDGMILKFKQLLF